jgi:hypothetical protein
VIKRLRPAHTPQRLAEIYAQPHDHRKWLDHHLRVDVTIALARWLARIGIRSAADLSCGNAAIIDALDVEERHRGDLAPGWPITGPLEETLEQIPAVDMYICSETLEHVDDPAAVLKQIRAKTSLLVLSTPVEAWDDPNEEHYHAWDREGVEELLAAAGFTIAAYATADFRHINPQFYCFGMWAVV